MGHQIEHRVSVGNCQLTQCSCGRSALKIKDKVLLLSAREVGEIARVFRAIESNEKMSDSDLAVKLNWLSGGKEWIDFSPEG
jgi:hypothetical protein